MSNLSVRLGREDRLVDLLERLAPLAPGAGDVVRVEAPCSHEIFSHPAFFRILVYRWPQAKFVAAGLDGAPKRLAAGLGVAYASPASPDGETHHAGARESLLAHNFTFWEYLAYELRRKFARLRSPLGRGSRGAARWRQWGLPTAAFVVVATALFFAGSYAFVTRTTVTLVPQVATRAASANMTFAQAPDALTPRVVPVRPVDEAVSLRQDFVVHGVDESSSPRASGRVEVVNETGTGLRLRPSTRLVAPDGQVFRLQGWLDVPANGSAAGRAVGDLTDAQGRSSGTGANVATGTLLALPGLGDLRDKAWARATETFVGASDVRVPLFTQKDYAAAIAALRDRVLDKAQRQAADRLDRANQDDPVATWAVLPTAGSVELLGFTGAADAATGANVASVSFSAEASVRVLTFDRATAEVYLRQALFDRLLADRERFVALQPRSLRLTYEFSRIAVPFRLRATAEMDATVAPTLSVFQGDSAWPSKQEIAGKTVAQATAFLLLDPEVASIKVVSSPFWADGIAEDPTHIRFVIAQP